MNNLLQLNTSLFAEQGQSSLLAEQFTARFVASHPGTRVVRRDLANDPVPHLDASRFTAFSTPAEARTPEQRAAVQYSDALINELRRADVIVLGLPMYNFGVPSQLKSYFDQVARAGETFRYSSNGPVGLLTGKKAYVFATRGGEFLGTPWDTQTAFVRNFFRFVGIDDVEFLYAEGLARGDEKRNAAIQGAQQHITRLAA